jgi:hypothetical protein
MALEGHFSAENYDFTGVFFRHVIPYNFVLLEDLLHMLEYDFPQLLIIKQI